MNGENGPIDDQKSREAFVLFDVNGDGRITAAELESVLTSMGVSTSSAEVAQMIRDADLNGNGSVEFDEFLDMMRRYSESQRSKSPDDELREAFNVFDHNHDSYIDFGEIKRTMHFLGEAVTDAEVMAMIQEADQDHDGFVDFEEFKHMITLLRSRESLSKG